MPAFETSGQVTSGLTMSAGAVAAVGNTMLVGALQAVVAHRAAQADAAALDAWDRELRRARGDAAALGDLAKQAVTAMLDAEDEAAALQAEVAALRRAVAERDTAIRALAQ